MKIADITSPIRARLIANTYKQWIKTNDKVLDVGCGNGVVSVLLKKYLGVRVTGCDRDEYLIRDINYKGMANDSKLPFKNKEFDVAIFNDVLHHTTYNNQVKLIIEALRVAKKVAIFELKPTIIGKVLDFALNKMHNPKMNIPFTYRESEAWEGLFKRKGINYKKQNVSSPTFYPFSHVAYLLYY